MSETVTIPTLDGDASFNAYVARPEGTPKAAIIVIQEIFGVNPGIRRKCDSWAEEGYLAVAPDLFFRLKPGIELDPDVEEQFQEALGGPVFAGTDDGCPSGTIVLRSTDRFILMQVGAMDFVSELGGSSFTVRAWVGEPGVTDFSWAPQILP